MTICIHIDHINHINLLNSWLCNIHGYVSYWVWQAIVMAMKKNCQIIRICLVALLLSACWSVATSGTNTLSLVLCVVVVII